MGHKLGTTLYYVGARIKLKGRPKNEPKEALRSLFAASQGITFVIIRSTAIIIIGGAC